MPKLYYAGHTFELAPTYPGENIANRIDQGLTDGRNLVANTKVPTNMILAVTRLANGNDLIFGFSGSLPIAIESDSGQKDA
ncbi:hypothetical protein [Rhodoglobus aureus]|uniref:Uncharacterized protein n=1 Tax=Rhodoglobus aureus TaxID=191497 RepID=A0ABP4G1X7_9MICO